MSKTTPYKDRLIGIGCMLMSSNLLFHKDLFPEHRRYGHWFWIGVVGAVMSTTGFGIGWWSRIRLR